MVQLEGVQERCRNTGSVLIGLVCIGFGIPFEEIEMAATSTIDGGQGVLGTAERMDTQWKSFGYIYPILV